jgi:hypothetical protein
VIAGNFFSFIPVLLGLLAVQPAAMQQGVTRLVGQDEVILRVTIEPRPMQRLDWIERKGPKCVPLSGMRAALISGPDQIDFIYASHARVRAQFDEDCPALDFYGSFYLQPDGDMLCARRDAVHSRMGGSCTIERFKMLVPKLRG